MVPMAHSRNKRLPRGFSLMTLMGKGSARKTRTTLADDAAVPLVTQRPYGKR